MRSWFLKFMGLIMWAAFLFAPFVVRAEEGFDTAMPQVEENVLLSVGGIDLQLDDRNKLQMPIKDKWSVRLKAGKDTVLTNDQPAFVRHDRVQLDDGERESVRFGVGLNYSF